MQSCAAKRIAAANATSSSTVRTSPFWALTITEINTTATKLKSIARLKGITSFFYCNTRATPCYNVHLCLHSRQRDIKFTITEIQILFAVSGLYGYCNIILTEPQFICYRIFRGICRFSVVKMEKICYTITCICISTRQGQVLCKNG